MIVVDGSGEIAGDGRVPHPCIGQARRMPVPSHMTQAGVAMEALQNHNAEVSRPGPGPGQYLATKLVCTPAEDPPPHFSVGKLGSQAGYASDVPVS